jgi:hypothetical protein
VNTLLIFMMLSLILGLWTKPRVRTGVIFLAGAAALLAIYLWIRPSQF